MDSIRLSGQLARPPRCYEAQTGTHSGARIYQGSHGHALERALPRAGILTTGRTGTPSVGRPLERAYLPRVGRARRQTGVSSSVHIYHGSSGHALGRASVSACGDHLARWNQLAAHDQQPATPPFHRQPPPPTHTHAHRPQLSAPFMRREAVNDSSRNRACESDTTDSI